MAIVGVRGPRAPIRKKEKEKADPLDLVLKGLGVAQSVFGIKSAHEQGQLNQLKIAEAERLGERQKQLAETESISPEQFAKTSIEISDPEQFKKEFGAVPVRNVRVLGPTGEAREIAAVDKDAFKLFTDAKRKDRELSQKSMLASQKGKTKRDPASAFAAAGFADRISESNVILDDLELKGFDRSGFSTALQSNILGPLGEFGEFFKSGELKEFEQAQRNFVNAVLRRESGAAIAPSEFDSAEKQYFPIAGDTPKVIEQKRRNRMLVQNSLRREAEGNLEAQPQFARGPREQIADRGKEFKLPGETSAFADEDEDTFLKGFIDRNKPTQRQRQPEQRSAPVQFGNVRQPSGTPRFGGSL